MNKHFVMNFVVVFIVWVLALVGSQPWDRSAQKPAEPVLSQTTSGHETLSAGFVGTELTPSVLSRPDFPEPAFLVMMGFGLISLAGALKRASKPA